MDGIYQGFEGIEFREIKSGDEKKRAEKQNRHVKRECLGKDADIKKVMTAPDPDMMTASDKAIKTRVTLGENEVLCSEKCGGSFRARASGISFSLSISWSSPRENAGGPAGSFRRSFEPA